MPELAFEKIWSAQVILQKRLPLLGFINYLKI